MLVRDKEVEFQAGDGAVEAVEAQELLHLHIASETRADRSKRNSRHEPGIHSASQVDS